MKFKSLCLIFVILSETSVLKHVVAHETYDLPVSSPTEDEFIKNLFIKNLEEDYRDYSNEKLTPEIAAEISKRYQAFRESRRRNVHARDRLKRETKDGLGKEKF